MSKCIKCGAQFVGTAADVPPDGLCKYCELNVLKDHKKKLEEIIYDAKDLLLEVMYWHSLDSPEYNNCDKDKCYFCEQATAVIERLEKIKK